MTEKNDPQNSEEGKKGSSNSEQGKQKTSEEDEGKKTQNPTEDLKNRVSNFSEKERLEKEKKEINEMMEKADKKVKDLTEVVDKLERQGITQTGEPKKSPEDEVKEKADEALKRFKA